MRKSAAMFALFSLGLVSGAAAQAQRPSVPVILQGGTGLDPCGVGMVSGLSADGDGFLAVRSGPRADAPKLDGLVNGDTVFVCDERGAWLGVIYSKADRDCGTSSALPRSSAYSGPCPSGWVFHRWIRMVAG